jgi:hypothetical protein
MGPTLAMIGERGPEAVVPLRGGDGASIVQQHFHFHGDIVTDSPEDFVDQVNEKTDSSGRALSAIGAMSHRARFAT